MIINNEISFVAWGPFALFTRPETRADRVSYSVPTPSACQGIANSVFWKPEMVWDVLQISVLRPWWILRKFNYPRTTTIKRNEVKTATAISSVLRAMKNGTSPKKINVTEDGVRTQRVSLLLKDVAYRITIRPIVQSANGGQNNENKYLDMMRRRLEKGQFYHKPYFGCREFACNVRLAKEKEPVVEEVNLDCGLMIHHLNYNRYPPSPVWFHAIVRNGILNCDRDIVEIIK